MSQEDGLSEVSHLGVRLAEIEYLEHCQENIQAELQS
jgi:hypothetical protein